ncbi:hypothetical protein KKA50_02945 [Patescibacteria group bacterium]|nr:hypothetical protein [Patescibacteria group bacterium]
MKFETVAAVVIGSIIIGILGGFAARSFWIGIGLPVVLIVLGLMWLALRPSTPVVEETPKEEVKREDTTQPRQE